jgi:glucosamine kinase
MILVADSGSTKTDWMAHGPDGKISFHTQGLNPYFVNANDVVKILSKNKDLAQYASEIKEVYFFGSGCSSPDKHEVISNGLSSFFTNAFISVDHDLIGCAYATCGDKKGLSCILGTGSSIAYYDGLLVTEGKHGLGYVLGDEGSGTFFGKKILLSYLYKTMPVELKDSFEEDFKVDKEIVVENIYSKPFPNTYLAAFAKFMKKHQNHTFIQEVLKTGFQEFVDSNIKEYKQHKTVTCNFVGSIAYHFQDELKDVLVANNLKIGNILQKPIDGIYDYILKREGILV